MSADDRTAQLRWFLVDPDLRRAGLGRQLLTEAVAFARESGYETVILWTVSVLKAASRLYASVGFRRVSAEPRRLWGVDVVDEKYELALRSPH